MAFPFFWSHLSLTNRSQLGIRYSLDVFEDSSLLGQSFVQRHLLFVRKFVTPQKIYEWTHLVRPKHRQQYVIVDIASYFTHPQLTIFIVVFSGEPDFLHHLPGPQTSFYSDPLSSGVSSAGSFADVVVSNSVAAPEEVEVSLPPLICSNPLRTPPQILERFFAKAAACG